MKDPNIKVKVVHSQSKDAWNVIGTMAGLKYKIARVPYQSFENKILDTRSKSEALEHAEFIAYCFNNSSKLLTNK